MSEIKVSGLTFKQEGAAPAPAPVVKKQQPADKDEVTQISAKLHPEYDRDLKEMIKRIPKRDRSALYRKAVRLYLESQS